ncbi:MAG: methyltransferase [Ignavibacteriales bacterium]|nr:methyltransferase [Ignavibacteriales bacterium]
MLVTLPIYGRIPYYFWHVAHILTRSNSTYPIFLSIQFLFGFFIMLIPTIFLGMTLPVASRIASRTIQVLGRSIGNVFSVNTLGTVVGSLAAGLMLIPAVGVKHTIEIGLVLNLIAGIIILMADVLRPTWKKVTILFTTVVVGGMSLVIVPEWNRLFMITGVFRQINRNAEPPPSFAAFSSIYAQDDLLYYKEGASATVAVLESRYANTKQNVLLVNGKPDASSRADLPTQVLLAQLPLVFHPRAQDALVIGLGSGVTVGSVLTHPVRSVDCVEISPEVVEASVHFNHVNNHPLEDPRTHLHIDDALSFLKLTNKNYDVIVSEPSNPWIAGIGSLYTREFFQKCRERLNPGGLMVQWFHLYEMDDETFKLVVQTFQSSFQSVTVWQSMTMDVILIGSEKQPTLDMTALREKLNQLRIKQDIERIRIADPVVLLSLQMVSQDRLSEYVGYGEMNTEDLPLLEYWAPRAFFVNKGVRDFSRFDERLNGGSGTILLQKYKEQFGLSDEEKRSIGTLHTTADGGNNQLGYSLLQDYLHNHPEEALAVELYSDACARLNRRDEGLDYLKRLAVLRSNDPNVLEKYATVKYQSLHSIMSAIAPISIAEPESLLKRCVELSADSVDRFRIELGDMYLDVCRYPEAVNNYRRALEIREGHEFTQRIPQDLLLYKYATALSYAGDDRQAIAYAVQAYALNADNLEAKDLAYALYMKKGSGGDSTVK